MSMGYVINGQYVKKAGNLSILNTPVASETDNGLMSYADKTKLDKTYTSDDIATADEIASEIFGK